MVESSTKQPTRRGAEAAHPEADVPGREISGMLSVSRTVARGGPLSAVLDRVAREAAEVVAARSASILLLRGRHFKLAGSHGLSHEYSRRLQQIPTRLAPGLGPSGLAVEEGRPVVFEDTDVDPRFEPWRELARGEGYRALVSIPLKVERANLGALNLYRAVPGPWPHGQLELLLFFAEHASSAIRSAQLIDRQGRQLGGLRRLVRALREQAHEHANRIHAIGGLLALDEYAEAKSFVASLEGAHHSSYGAVSERIRHATLAGLILAEATIARQRGIALEIAEDSALDRLPATLDDADAVTIVGNLLENAFDAVSSLPKPERRVVVRVSDVGDETGVEVWNPGAVIPVEQRESLFQSGYTTKPEHAGLGLALVADAVAWASGQIEVDCSGGWTRFVVRVPNA